MNNQPSLRIAFIGGGNMARALIGGLLRQGVPAAPPIFATPASVTFGGVGNFAVEPVAAKPKSKSKSAKCKRGYVRKKGRCVKRAKDKKAKKSTAKGRK